MSDRGSTFGNSTHTDPWEAAQRPGTGQSGQQQDDAYATGQQAADGVKQKGQQAKEKVDETAHMAQDRADQGMHRAAEGLDQAAGMIRERGGQQGGTMGSMATTAADGLDKASTYLRDKDTDQLMGDLEAYIRQNPTQSLLIAAGVGFVLSKVFK
jgi:ElaB/YqjD/DUF883 family membrane-anchored ribosome-binding protein